MGSILAFQKLSGTLSTEGKILDELIKLNNKGNIELQYAFNQLYPNKLPKLIEKTFANSPDIWEDWNVDEPMSFGGNYFGRWTITLFDENRDDPPAVGKICFMNKKAENLIYLRGGDAVSAVTFLGQLSSARKLWGNINFSAHFLGYKVLYSFLWNIVGFTPEQNLTVKYGGFGLVKPLDSGFIECEIFEGNNAEFNVQSDQPFRIVRNGEPYLYPSEVGGLYDGGIIGMQDGGKYTIEKVLPKHFNLNALNVVDLPDNMQYAFVGENSPNSGYLPFGFSGTDVLIDLLMVKPSRVSLRGNKQFRVQYENGSTGDAVFFGSEEEGYQWNLQYYPDFEKLNYTLKIIPFVAV